MDDRLGDSVPCRSVTDRSPGAKVLRSALSIALLTLLGTGPLLAGNRDDNGSDAGAEEQARWELEWKNSFRLTRPGGDLELRFGGRIQNDWAFYDADERLEAALGALEDGTEFRRARLFIQGELWHTVEFKAQYDFAGGDAEFKDVYLGLIDLPGVGGVRVGHYKEPFSLEEQTSSKYLLFMERSTAVEAFSPSRNNGFMLGHGAGGERLTWHLGAFKDVDDFGDRLSDEWNLTARVTGLPRYGDAGRRLVHLGLAVSERSPNGDRVRFRSRPESHLAPRFVDTGVHAADGVTLVDLEAAVVHGPLVVQSEWIQAEIDALGGADPSFDGYYLALGWVLTGEHHPYSKSSGAFGRLSPSKSFRRGGTGAWELAVRYSALDLTDGAVQGGELTDWTLGLNWYLFSNVRSTFNYVHADLEGVGGADALQMRFQIDF